MIYGKTIFQYTYIYIYIFYFSKKELFHFIIYSDFIFIAIFYSNIFLLDYNFKMIFKFKLIIFHHNELMLNLLFYHIFDLSYDLNSNRLILIFLIRQPCFLCNVTRTLRVTSAYILNVVS